MGTPHPSTPRRPADSTIDREKIGPNIEIGGVRRVTSGEGFRISVDGVAVGEDWCWWKWAVC